jgi:hypothetical protein
MLSIDCVSGHWRSASPHLAHGHTMRLRRGGSWNNNPRNCRSAYRNSNHPDNRNNTIGFRVCCLPPAPFIAGAAGWESSGSVRRVRDPRVQTCSGDPSPSGEGIRTAPAGRHRGFAPGSAPFVVASAHAVGSRRTMDSHVVGQVPAPPMHNGWQGTLGAQPRRHDHSPAAPQAVHQLQP